MKKITIITLVGIALTVGYSFKTIHEISKTSAEVSLTQGIAVFMDSKPVKEYEIIGEVKLAKISTNNSSYSEAKKTLIEKCLETYPTGEGIIIENVPFTTRYSAKVIAFKK